MNNVFEKAVDITTDLAAGNVSIRGKLQSSGNNEYNLIPTGIMVTKNSAADEVAAVVCSLRGGVGEITLYLKINVLYPLSVDKVIKAGTTPESIILFGLNN